MTNSKIEFKKQRELGEILSDTFAFIRQQFKSYFSTVLKIVGPYILIALAGLGLYLYSLGSFMNFASLGNSLPESKLMYLFLSIILLLIGGIATYALSYSVTLNYIWSYDKNDGVVNDEEVRKGVRDTFWNIIGLGILVVLILFVATFLCCLPAVYLWVPLSLSYPLLVFRKLSIGNAISDSFKLIQDEWWMTFATMLVVFIIIAIAGYAFSIPALIYTYVKMGISMGQNDFAEGDLFFADPIYIALNILSYFFQYILNLITLISTVFIYFHLNEKKNFTGTFKKIDSLGGNSTN